MTISALSASWTGEAGILSGAAKKMVLLWDISEV